MNRGVLDLELRNLQDNNADFKVLLQAMSAYRRP